ncbi:YcjF family protein [Paradevosia shaoguanensis]|uniref:YcjF family protein n=1 Tax=Paradevosia shaoguanensis TaxID=1335043 RepID=UPI003C7777CE
MKRPVARTINAPENTEDESRLPRAFAPAEVDSIETVEPGFEEAPLPDTLPNPGGMGWLGRLAWTTGGILVSLGLGLAAERLMRDLFARYEWLGWLGIAALAAFVVAIIALAFREFWSLRRLRSLDRLRQRATETLVSDKPDDARRIVGELQTVYASRADLAKPRSLIEENLRIMLDGAEMIQFSERVLMAPLDARARALTAASARRVALVTAISPRALIDIAFVSYESIRLGGAIASLYGAKPSLFGSIRLTGAILGHLAVTGGLVLTDGVMEQLVGQGLAAKLSARLGEGVVNSLMTVRVGIAAMRVVRPLPFATQPQPMVKDFLPELVNLAQGK